MIQTREKAEELFVRLEEEIQRILPDAGTTTVECQVAGIWATAEVLPRYFIPLMENALKRFDKEKDKKAWWAFSHNLEDEIRQDHPGLLRQFAQSCISQILTNGDLAEVQREVVKARTGIQSFLIPQFEAFMRDSDPFPIVMLMTALEVTSESPVRWMHGVAAKLGSEDLKWAEIHGKADIEHAKLHLQVFINLVEERNFNLPEDPLSDPVLKTAFELWNITLALGAGSS